jgi:hypothetical protein
MAGQSENAYTRCPQAENWHGFAKLTLWGTLSVIAIVGLMALFLI